MPEANFIKVKTYKFVRNLRPLVLLRIRQYKKHVRDKILKWASHPDNQEDVRGISRNEAISECKRGDNENS